jgi:hypothetical protein
VRADRRLARRDHLADPLAGEVAAGEQRGPAERALARREDGLRDGRAHRRHGERRKLEAVVARGPSATDVGAGEQSLELRDGLRAEVLVRRDEVRAPAALARDALDEPRARPTPIARQRLAFARKRQNAIGVRNLAVRQHEDLADAARCL